MPQAKQSAHEPASAPRIYSPLAGFLSYLVPGLGQIYQGRVSKGVLFLVCLFGLFFCGMSLGSWKNVYIPDARKLPPANLNLRVAMIELHGARKAIYYRLQYLGQFWMGIASWPALWQYLNYDEKKESSALLGSFERAPTREEVFNDLQRDDDKHWDLGWVYTVIAGVLNILVIYDAFAGPVFSVSHRTDPLAPEASSP